MKKTFLVLGGFITGFILAIGVLGFIPASHADSSCTINQNELNLIYNLAFHRQPDSGANGYVGQGLDFSLNQLLGSPENQYYSEVYNSVKELEGAERSSSSISSSAINTYYSDISQSLQNLEKWANPNVDLTPIYGSGSSSSGSTSSTFETLTFSGTGDSVTKTFYLPAGSYALKGSNSGAALIVQPVDSQGNSVYSGVGGYIMVIDKNFTGPVSASQQLTIITSGTYSLNISNTSGGNWTASISKQ